MKNCFLNQDSNKNRLYIFFILINFIFFLQIGHTQIIPVSNNNDSGVGSLRQAIIDANLAGDTNTIDMTGIAGIITLLSPLPVITSDMDIVGPGIGVLTVSGENTFRIFTVESGTVNFSDFTVANGLASGGKGGDDSGGGGAGMGSAIFINSAQVDVKNMEFINNSAVGGDGGRGEFYFSGGGGGGMTGAGGNTGIGFGGGGGGGFAGPGQSSGSNDGGAGGSGDYYTGGIDGFPGDFGVGGIGDNGGGGGGSGDANAGDGGRPGVCFAAVSC